MIFNNKKEAMKHYRKDVDENLNYFSLYEWSVRRIFVEELGMYALVTYDWVKPLAEFLKGKKCLEVLAGCGWLSYALHGLGVDVIATDDFSWETIHAKNKVFDVEQLDVIESIKKYQNISKH